MMAGWCGYFVVQLVNQNSDLDHHEEMIHLNDHAQISSRRRVSIGDKASSGCGNAYFICNHKVESITSTKQYLKIRMTA